LKKASCDLEAVLCERRGRSCDPAAAPAQATASALRLEAGVASPARLTRNSLHPYRLKVKELQNVLRLAQGSDNQEFLDALGAVKDSIGEWHDWEQLLSIATDVLDHGAQCKLRRKLKTVCEQQYQYAFTEAEKMRREYLGFSAGTSKPGLKKAAKPVWTATAAMAA